MKAFWNQLRLRVLGRWAGVDRQLALASGLAVLVAVTQVLLWLQEDVAQPSDFTGPPRTDFQLQQVTVKAFNQQGALSFTVQAPRLVKHPYLGTYRVDAPRFEWVDAPDSVWRGTANSAWIDPTDKQIRLEERVDFFRAASATEPALRLQTNMLQAWLESNRIQSQEQVTLTTPGSILQAVGLEADLKLGTFTLHRQVTARYDPKIR